jgi:hypothetical protein
MEYLEIVDSQGRRRHVPLDRPHLLIGRESSCDIHLAHPAVSRRHAQLQATEQGRWLLQDLQSRNHVYLDNRPVQQLVLEPGKPVRIAQFRLALQGPVPLPELDPAKEKQDDTTDSWADLDRSWLKHLQSFQRALLRLDEPRMVLEYLAGEFIRIVHPQLLAVGLAGEGGPKWEVVRSAECGAGPVLGPVQETVPPQLGEAERHMTDAESRVQTWTQMEATSDSATMEPSECLLFPMKGRSGVIGHVYIQGPRASPLPSGIPRYLSMATTLAGLIWDNLHLARLRLAQKEYEQELCRARQIQVELLPASFDLDSRLDVFGVNLPSARISGDYFDVFRVAPDTIAFLVADAMGHGMPAALVMATVRAALRMGLSLGLSWKAAFRRLDDIITQGRSDVFVTGIVGQIDLATQKLYLVAAGHPLPSILVDGQPVPVPARAQTRPWGVPLEVDWEVGQIALAGRTWSILCYTDGVLDAAVRTQRTINSQRIAAYHQAHHNLSAEDLCQGLLNEFVVQQSPLSLYDDQTALALCRGLVPGPSGK